MSLTIRPFRPDDEQQVIDLWKRCNLVVPWNDPRKDIARKLKVDGELFLVGEDSNRIVAVVMAGYDGHRGQINYLAVEPGEQRTGIGRRMMEEAETRLKSLGCPKINLQVRASNTQVIAFYEAMGYKLDEVVSLGKRLENDV